MAEEKSICFGNYVKRLEYPSMNPHVNFQNFLYVRRSFLEMSAKIYRGLGLVSGRHVE